MWDGHLGQVNMAKHCILLTVENTQLIHFAPYQAGPRTRKFKNAKTDKMPAQKVIETAQTEWATPIVSDPEKDGCLRFCVDY